MRMAIPKLLALHANAIKVKLPNIKRKERFFMYLMGNLKYVRLKKGRVKRRRSSS